MHSALVEHSGGRVPSPAAPASPEFPPLTAPVPALAFAPLDPPSSPLPPVPAFPPVPLATQTLFTHSVLANCGPRLVQSFVTLHWSALSSKNSEQPLLTSRSGTEASQCRIITRFSTR